mgnify:CR=1 FL=1
MAFSSFPVNDNALTSHPFGVKTIASREFSGHIAVASTEGGATPYQNLDVDETGVVVKASAGQIYGILAFNLAGYTPSGTLMRFLKIYDKATAATASDTPKLTIPLDPGNETPFVLPDCGVAFAAGIGIRATTGLAVADTGAPGTNEVVVNLLYA